MTTYSKRNVIGVPPLIFCQQIGGSFEYNKGREWNNGILKHKRTYHGKILG